MKALLLYSKASGRRDFSRYLSYAHKELDPVFEVLDTVCPDTREEAYEVEKNAYKNYDVLIIAGGDGTFNNAINAVMENEARPVIGYINNGTLGDAGRLFGITKSIKKSIKTIKRMNVKPCDIGKITVEGTSKYFSYMAAVGAYSDISYKTKRWKKGLGKFSYYWAAFKALFKKVAIKYEIFEEKGTAGFIMVLNGPYVGGFKVNKLGKRDDGLLDLFVSRGKMFNGLCSYATKKNVYMKTSEHLEILVKGDNLTWCIDGEEFLSGNAIIDTEKHAIRTLFK